MKRKQGFSLIELLVVIAIIAILVTIVVANVGGARGRARDTAAKATLKQVQVQAELEANGGVYDCDADQVAMLITSAAHKLDAGADASAATCSANGANGLAVDINGLLTSSGFDGDSFCVDTNGFSGAERHAEDGVCTDGI